jgi:Glyoxalase-like domain
LIDHLVYATPRLQATVDLLTQRLGVAPSPGGRHAGQGTRNYLLSLGGGSYLEIIGRDPEQPPPAGPRAFKLDDLEEPLLAGWAVRTRQIDEYVVRARSRGYDPGPICTMTRVLPDGKALHWKLTLRSTDAVPSLIPFLIDWDDTPHPSATATQGAELLTFQGETPDLSDTRRILDALEVDLELGPGARPSLTARIGGPRGEIVL